MQYGFIFFGRDLKQVGPIAMLGEDLGFDMVGLCDSPALAYDPYMALTLAAISTSRVWLGPSVTNPQTRHPLILANQASGLEGLAPGRTFLGLGVGNSGVQHAHAAPATNEGLRDSVQLIRKLIAGDDVVVDGRKMTVKGAGKRVPILIAGSGPKSLRLAGQIADMVYVNVGVLPEVVEDGIRWVREGAEASGRDPASVECWTFGIGAVREEREQALDEVKGAVVGVANYILRGDPKPKRIPPNVAEKAQEMFRRYQYGEHLTPGHTSNYHLAEQLGIADYLLERFAIAGTPEDCQRKIEALRQVGVDRICLSFSASPDVAAYVRLFGERVLPASVG